MKTLTDLKTLKNNDSVTILAADTGVTYDCTVTKAGAAHLMCTSVGADPQSFRIARATGAQVSAKPVFYVCDVVADAAGNTYDARHTVSDLTLDDVDVEALHTVFGATPSAQVVTRDFNGTQAQVRYVVQVAGRTFASDGTEGIGAVVKHAVDAAKPAPGDSRSDWGARSPEEADMSEAPAAYELTPADRATCARVAQANADLKRRDGVTAAFAPAYFAKTKTLLKLAGANAAHLTALCELCAAEGNRILGVTPAAPVQPEAPAPVEAPAAPVVAPVTKAKRAAKAPAITDAEVQAAKVAIRAVSAALPGGVSVHSDGAVSAGGEPVAMPAAAPVVDAPALTTGADVEDTRHPIVLEYDLALLGAGVQGSKLLQTFRTSLVAFCGTVQAPVVTTLRNTRSAPAKAATAPVQVDGALSPKNAERADAIGRKLALTKPAAGSTFTAADAIALGHYRMDRVAKPHRDAVAAAAAAIANTVLAGGGAAAPASTDKPAAKAGKAPAAPKAKAVTAGCTVQVRPEFVSEYEGVLTPEEVNGLTVAKVTGARVFAKNAAGEEVRLPFAHVVAK